MHWRVPLQTLQISAPASPPTPSKPVSGSFRASSIMASTLNGRQKRALSEHVGVVILQYYNDDPPPWFQIDTQTQTELWSLMIDRLRDKACGDVAEILSFNAKEFAVRVIQQRLKSLREKKKRDERKKDAQAHVQGWSLCMRREPCSFNHHKCHSWIGTHQVVKGWNCLMIARHFLSALWGFILSIIIEPWEQSFTLVLLVILHFYRFPSRSIVISQHARRQSQRFRLLWRRRWDRCHAMSFECIVLADMSCSLRNLVFRSCVLHTHLGLRCSSRYDVSKGGVFFSWLTAFKVSHPNLESWNTACKEDWIVQAVKMIKFSYYNSSCP